MGDLVLSDSWTIFSPFLKRHLSNPLPTPLWAPRSDPLVEKVELGRDNLELATLFVE